jgi:hypothetical protein
MELIDSPQPKQIVWIHDPDMKLYVDFGVPDENGDLHLLSDQALLEKEARKFANLGTALGTRLARLCRELADELLKAGINRLED